MWLTSPLAAGGSQVAYSGTLVESDSIASARVVVLSACYFRLYVNGVPVSVVPHPLVRAPYLAGDGDAAACSFDITRWLHAGSNSLTLHCCPSEPSSTTAFCLRVSGRCADGRPIAYAADRSWLCQTLADSLTSAGAEWQDGRRRLQPVDECVMRWHPAAEMPVGVPAGGGCHPDAGYESVSRVLRPRFFSVAGDGRSVMYDFGKGVYGVTRVTLRAPSGMVVTVNDAQYVCRGQIDEQFVAHFSPSWFRKLRISGGTGFDPSMVTTVEVLEPAHVAPLWR